MPEIPEDPNIFLILIGAFFILIGMAGKLLIEKVSVQLSSIISRVMIIVLGSGILFVGILGVDSVRNWLIEEEPAVVISKPDPVLTKSDEPVPVAPQPVETPVILSVEPVATDVDINVPLEISALTVHSDQSDKYSIMTVGLNMGKMLYSDNKMDFATVPNPLANKQYIKTVNEDKDKVGLRFLSFDVNKKVHIYVLHDHRITQKPAWLTNGFELLPYKVRVRDPGPDWIKPDFDMDVFKSSFDKGTVSFGGNSGGKNSSMYSVVIAE